MSEAQQTMSWKLSEQLLDDFLVDSSSEPDSKQEKRPLMILKRDSAQGF